MGPRAPAALLFLPAPCPADEVATIGRAVLLGAAIEGLAVVQDGLLDAPVNVTVAVGRAHVSLVLVVVPEGLDREVRLVREGAEGEMFAEGEVGERDESLRYCRVGAGKLTHGSVLFCSVRL